jgi:hypothetical protein
MRNVGYCFYTPWKPLVIVICMICAMRNSCAAQSLLANTVTIKAQRLPLHDVLTILSNEANVTFSYNTKVINRDSLVTVFGVNKPLGDVLRMLFNADYEFKESGSYVIIRRKSLTTSGTVVGQASKVDHYLITGKVVDEESGYGIPDVSVYEKQQLLSSITDATGNFSLKLKTKYPEASLSINKIGYTDTTLVLQPKFNQKVVVALAPIAPEPIVEPIAKQDTLSVMPTPSTKEYDAIEKTWWGRVLLSSKQKIQSLNLKKFYTTRAYQISFVPGISTHGSMNSRVVTHTSINIIGGYTGGVDGIELGGVFNMNHNDVKYLQMGGVFNMVGGSVTGVQAAGLYNDVRENMDGVQMASAFNLVGNVMNGLQISTLYNYAREVQGVQIGFINKTRSQTGTSIGLINISQTASGKKKVGFLVRLPRG